MKKILPIVALIAVIGLISYLLLQKNDTELHPQTETTPPPPAAESVSTVITGTPTDFVDAGIAVMNNPGLKPGVLYLIYENPGESAVTKELQFDALSACVTETGATPCVAMSATLDIPFQNKNVLIEGNSKGGGVILVRKLRRLMDGEVALLHDPGRIFIPWPQAVALIKDCKVSQVMQTHSLDIMLLIKESDTEVVAVEPTIDTIFPIVQDAKCPDVTVATE